MAIHGINEQGGRVPPKSRENKISNSNFKVTVELLNQEIVGLKERLASYENQDGSPIEGDQVVDQLNSYKEFFEQFQSILEKDRDGIQETAKELGINFKANEADRDVLSKCFDVMFDKMIGADRTVGPDDNK